MIISFGGGSKGKISPNSNPSCKKPKQKYTDHINKLNIDEEFKKSLLDRISIMDCSEKKDLQWLETLIRVPFGKYSTIDLDKTKPKDIENFFDNAVSKLDESVHGLDNVKQEIINYIAQFISIESSNPRIIALQGSAGIGKTSIIKRGVSDILKRPIRSISMGGISDSNHFLGFDFTYSGSRHGIIVQSLIETGVMNPIIFMDELDKISETNDGQEIQNMLVHITDPVQNNCFEDKYFSGINIDLSKAIFIFSFNNVEKINPILKDRLHLIKVLEPSFDDKMIISNKYLIPEICKNIGFKQDDITFDEDSIRHIINLCKYEKGVRGIKKHIESIILQLNVARFIKKGKYNTIDKITLPYKVNRELAKKIIKPEDEIPASIQMMYL
jgi:ATP-dependent Lon protease